MRIDLVPEHPDELEIVKTLNLDWLLYGEMHMTNAHGLTRLDPRGITYAPQKTEVSVSDKSSSDAESRTDRAQNA